MVPSEIPVPGGIDDMMEGSARASVNGTLTEPRLTATSAKVVDAALQGVCQDLAARLGRR